MRARRIAAEMREWKRIEEERHRLERLEKERLAREKQAADEVSIEESLKYVQILTIVSLYLCQHLDKTWFKSSGT